MKQGPAKSAEEIVAEENPERQEQRNNSQQRLEKHRSKDNQKNVKLADAQDTAEDPQILAIRRIESATAFFNKKYMGNKGESIVNIRNKVLRAPKLKKQALDLIQIKTKNLNVEVKAIEKIFKTEKGKKAKKTEPVFSEFDLYLTKRDIIKDRNEELESMRRQYRTQRKLQLKQKRKTSVNLKEVSDCESEKEEAFPQLLKLMNAKESSERHEFVQKQEKTEVKNNESTEKGQEEKPKLSDGKPNKIEKAGQSTSFIPKFKVATDEEIQERFESKNLPQKWKGEIKFSLRSLIQSKSKSERSLLKAGYLQKEHQIIGNVARKTISNFKSKQPVKLGGTMENSVFTPSFTPSYNSGLNTGRLESFSDFHIKNFPLPSNDRSINWVLSECENYRKNFLIRKAKSQKKIGPINQNTKKLGKAK